MVNDSIDIGEIAREEIKSALRDMKSRKGTRHKLRSKNWFKVKSGVRQ